MKKKFQKNTSVNFVGPDPRLLEIGAKWSTHWALKLKIKKIKGVRGLAQEAQPSDLYPYARKSDTWVQKIIIKKKQKTVFFKTITQEVEKRWSFYKNCVLEDILIYHLRLKENFFFLKKKFRKILSVNFVGPDPRLLEIGAKWRTHWALKLKIKKNKGFQRAGSRGTALWPVPICQKIWHMGTKKNHQKTAKNNFFIWKTQSGSRKELFSLINSVLEDISIYHLRLKRIFFFKVSKNYKC